MKSPITASAGTAVTERFESEGELVALVVRRESQLGETSFLTTPEQNLQVGFIVYPAGGEIPRHAHRPPERRVDRTSEALLVWRGTCEVELYDERQQLLATVELRQGDVIVLLRGGHGFTMLEDTVLLEIKQGPYVGVEEKLRF